MAIKLDGRDDNLKRRNFIDFGERFSIPASATASMLDKMLRKFSMSLEILESITMTAKKRALVNKVIAKRRKDLL